MKPLDRPDQITNPTSVAEALRSLLRGRDENRDTRAKGWDKAQDGEEIMSQNHRMWYEELEDIDAMISEAEELPLTPLPTGELAAQLEEATHRLSTWYAAPMPIFQKRKLHIHYDELAEVAGDLRTGKINAAEAGARFQDIMADVSEIEGFSKFFMGD